MTGMTMQTSLFERALMRLEAEAAGDHGHFTPRGLARQYLVIERASGEARDQAIAGELGEQSNRLLKSVAEAVSRDIGDVAAKLAVAIIEGNNGETGTIADAQRGILAHALAELVIMSDGPLPRAAVLTGMTEAELERQKVPMNVVDREIDGEAA